MNVLTILLTALGFAVYALMSAWGHQVLSPAGIRAQAVALPADAVVLTPPWAQEAVLPDLSVEAVTRKAGIAATVRQAAAALAVPVFTDGGTVRAWGLDPGSPAAASLRVVVGAGDLSSTSGDVLVAKDFAAAHALGVGSRLRLAAVTPDQRWQAAEFRVAGIYDPNGPLMGSVVLSKEALSRLTGYTRDNALFLWGGPGLRAALPDALTVTREPEFPPGFAPAMTVDHFRGAPIPFGFLTGQFALMPSTPAAQVQAVVAAATGRNLTPLAMALFALMGVAVTILQVVRVLDAQRVLGTFKSLGETPSQTMRRYTMSGAFNMLVAAILARGLFELVADVLNARHASHLAFHPGVYFIWLCAAALFAWWAGKVPAILTHTAATRSLLLRANDFDWFALIRF